MVMNVRLMLALLPVLGLSGCKELFGREPMVRQLTQACEAQVKDGAWSLRGASCDCFVRAATADFSQEELSLWLSEPTLFEKDELKSLLARRAASCLKGPALADCARLGAQSRTCGCLVTRLVDEYEGDGVVDALDLVARGQSISADYADLTRRCAGGGP